MKLGKSKLALARVINENGGWPERALWAVQDNCIAFFLGGKPEYKSGDRCWHSNSIDGACVWTITCDEKVTNWHQTVLSREECYQAYPKADADGWIEWSGGECPVERGTLVDVKYSGGEESFGVSALTEGWHDDHVRGSNGKRTAVNWVDTLPVSGIIAYRLHKPEVKPGFCESVMRSIPGSESIDELCAKVTEENKHQHVDAKPAIEQLAQDYRNKLDFAKRKQQEADDAKVAAYAALGELERAGDELGLIIGVKNPTHELSITDWRDLQVGDIVFIESMRRKNAWSSAMVGRECIVVEDGEDYPICFVNDFTPEGQSYWVGGVDDGDIDWRFIRRP